MLRMSPPLGDLLRLGDDGAEGRALLVKRAAVMDVDTVSVKAFPLWSDEETREAKGWLDDNGLRIGEVIPFYQGRHLGFHDPALHEDRTRELLGADAHCRHDRRAVRRLRLGQGVRLGFTRYLVGGDVEGAQWRRSRRWPRSRSGKE